MNPVRRERPSYGVLWSEIHMEGNTEHGSGRFVARVESDALRGRALIATVSHIANVNVAIGIRPKKNQIVVLVGDNKTSERQLRKTYQLPPNSDGVSGHEFRVEFNSWALTSVQLDGTSLTEVPSEDGHDGHDGAGYNL